MSLKSFNYGLLVAIALTLAATQLHSWLPAKRLSLIPGNQYTTFVFSNHEPSEPNYGELLSWEDHRMFCQVRDAANNLSCSFNLLISDDVSHGADLSQYQYLLLQVSYQGPEKRMRMYMRNFDPRYSTKEDTNSGKFHFVSLRVQDFQPYVRVELDEFKVADWWVSHYDLPRHLSRRELDNVVALGLDFEAQMAPGEHHLKVEKLEFVGDRISAEHWYQAIISLWMLVASIFVVLRLVQLRRRNLADQQRISELDGSNQRLQTEREQLRKLSTTDALTGALNRHGLGQMLDKLTAEQRAGSALILLDIDHFKRINDRRGHDTGDRILQAVAQLLQQHIREQDRLGRWGGEEFILLCPNTNAQRAFALAEKLRKLVSDTTFEPERPLTITASLGVAMFAPAETFQAAFKRADIALYQAKSQGRNCTILAGTE